MSEENNSKLEQIMGELPRVKRELLQEHLDTLSGDEKESFIKEVIAEYESIKKIIADKASAKADRVNETISAKAKISEPDFPSSDSSKKYPEFTFVANQPANADPQAFTKVPIHTKKQTRSKTPIVLLCSFLAIALAGGAVYAILSGKFPGMSSPTAAPETTPVTQQESSAAEETETTAAPTVAPLPTASEETEKTEEPTEQPADTPAPTSVPLKSNAPKLKGIKVVIDPGHQEKTDYKKEPFKKGTKNGKPRCTRGTTGVVTNQKEYELTLDTALMLKDYLEQCGATVIMTRTENDVNISNKERAQKAVKAKPTLFIRLHADAGNNNKVKGVRVYIPNSGKLNKKANANKLGKLVAKAGKTNFRGSKATNKYTGLNYASSIRSFQIVLGYLSNKDDDQRLADTKNRYEMVAAIATFCSTFKKG